MRFKTKPKYKLVKENYVGIGKGYIQNKDEIELSSKELLDLSYGIIPWKMVEIIVDWLKEENGK